MKDNNSSLSFRNYSDDEPVGIAAVEKSSLPGPIDPVYWRYVPQTAFHRFLSIGEVNGLHFSEVIDHVVDSVLDHMQCLSLENDLKFVLQIAEDDDLRFLVSTLQEMIDRIKSSNSSVLIISPP